MTILDYDEHESLAFRSQEEIAGYLDAIGDVDGAGLIRASGPSAQGLGATLGLKYLGSGHQFGYIEPDGDAIVPAATIAPDEALVGSAIKVTLDKFYVHEYPGLGRHTILLEVFGRNQAGADREDLRYATALEANDGDSAGVSGIPIFTGLNVPPDGLAFKALTVSVGSRADDMIIDALQSEAFQSGLKLLGHVQPILPQLVRLASGVTRSILRRTLNRQIQAFQLGLDFSGSATSCALRYGSYVVVQATDDGSWSWEDWMFDLQRQTIVSKHDGAVAPYNFLIFAIVRSYATEPRAASTFAKQAVPTKKMPRRTRV